MVRLFYFSFLWLHPDLAFIALVEQVRDGSTLRVRLYMPDSEHQVVNIALAGVRSARAATKAGEPSEPWGEEVGRHIRHIKQILTLLGIGQILHRISPFATTCPRCNTLSTNSLCYALPNRCK